MGIRVSKILSSSGSNGESRYQLWVNDVLPLDKFMYLLLHKLDTLSYDEWKEYIDNTSFSNDHNMISGVR